MVSLNKLVKPLLMLCLSPIVIAGCGGEGVVSFARDVKPILDQNCMQCHQQGGKGQQASGFGMETYAELMKGTRYGPMIIAGDVEGSNLVVLMEGRADPSISMPHGQQKTISKQSIETIKLWIDQGAKNN